MTRDNITGKNKEFYELGRSMFERLKPLKPIKPYFDTIQEDIDLLYKANSADIEALEDAKITLNVIKEIEPAFTEIIDSSLALIEKAMGMSYGDAMERVTNRAKGEPR